MVGRPSRITPAQRKIIEACVAENTSNTKPIGEIQRRTGLTVGEIYVERSRVSQGQPSNAETAKRSHNRRHPPGVIIMNEPLTWRAFSVMHKESKFCNLFLRSDCTQNDARGYLRNVIWSGCAHFSGVAQRNSGDSRIRAAASLPSSAFRPSSC